MPAKNHSTPRILPRLTEHDIRRFKAYINTDPGHGPNGDCHLWIGAKSPRGYGVFEMRETTCRAPRIAYLIHNGEDPYPNIIRHSCDFPSCVNGEHLLTGSQQDNVDDAVRRGRMPTGDRNGSRLKPENLVHGETHHNATSTDAEIVLMRTSYANGAASVTQLAEQYSMSISSICRILHGSSRKDAGGPIAQRHLAGHRGVTEDLVLAVHQDRDSNMSMQAIAYKHNRSLSTIQLILDRRSGKKGPKRKSLVY